MDSHRGELINLIEHNVVSQNIIDDVVNISNIMPTQRAWLTFINNLFLWIGCLALGFSFIFFWRITGLKLVGSPSFHLLKRL